MIEVASSFNWRQWTARCGITAALALLAANLLRMIDLGWSSATYLYDLDYGEGIVWQQMSDIAAGRGYRPLGVFPAIVYHYPPIYHLVVNTMAWTFGTDGLATGRMVSLLSSLFSVVLVVRLSFAAMPLTYPRRDRLVAALLAGGCIATSPTIVTWASLMRVDMLAGFLSLAGLALTIGSARQPMRVFLAALCFGLATYTKQTSVAAPAAAFVALWLAQPRAAWSLFAWYAAMGLVALAGLSLMSHGGFLRHTLLYNLNRLDLSRAAILPYVMLSQISSGVIALLGLVATWRRLRTTTLAALRETLRTDTSVFAVLLLFAFLIVKTAMLPTVLKSGANDNYLIEWLYAVAVFTGVGAVPVIASARTGRSWPRALLVLLVTVGVPVQAYRAIREENNLDVLRKPRADIVARIAASPRPVVGDAMVLIIRGGQPVRWEPAIAAELGHAGLYDENAFARLVRREYFGFFVTVGDRGDRIYDERYNPVVAAAIDAAYPRRERHGDIVLHLPRLPERRYGGVR